MVFKKFVEVGRVVRVSYGPDAGKIAVIVDILNNSTLLLDGTMSGIGRKKTPKNWVTLTKFVVPDITPSMHTVKVRDAFTKSGVQKQFDESAWGKRLAVRAKRATMTDFDRFKVAKARRARNQIVRRAINVAKKAAVKK